MKNLAVFFDNEKYLQEQTSAILERVNRFTDKLYLEFEENLIRLSCRQGLAWFCSQRKMRLL